MSFWTNLWWVRGSSLPKKIQQYFWQISFCIFKLRTFEYGLNEKIQNINRQGARINSLQINRSDNLETCKLLKDRLVDAQEKHCYYVPYRFINRKISTLVKTSLANFAYDMVDVFVFTDDD